MRISSKYIYRLNQNDTKAQNLREKMVAQFALLRSTIVSITSLFGIIFCLSVPSFSMDREILDDAYWLKLRTQKSVGEIYLSRGEEDSNLTNQEKNFLLYRCAREGFPLAQLEIAENLFARKLKMTLLFIEKFKMTLSTQLENEQSQDYFSILLSQVAGATVFIANPVAEGLAAEEWIIAKEFAKLGLAGLVDPKKILYSAGGTDYAMVASQFGISGFHPYSPYAGKLSLTPEESNTLFAHWKEKHEKSQTLFKYIPEIGGVVPFSCLYVTTPFWIECLEKNKEDADLFLLLHQFLIKLDGLPESDEIDLPWWKKGSGWMKPS